MDDSSQDTHELETAPVEESPETEPTVAGSGVHSGEDIVLSDYVSVHFTFAQTADTRTLTLNLTNADGSHKDIDLTGVPFVTFHL